MSFKIYLNKDDIQISKLTMIQKFPTFKEAKPL